MNFEQYQDYLIDTATSLLSIDSASGFTSNVADYLLKTIEELGYPVYKNNIGNVIVTVEGEDDTEPVALSAHVDTLGLMVRSITSDGMLMITSIGSPLLPSLDGEYCNIHTRDGRVYTGTILSLSPAIHVFPDASTRDRDEQNMAVRIDEIVHSKEDVEALALELTLLKIMKDNDIKPKHKTYICFSTHEEIGYGGATLPKDIKELLVVDMGCVGLDLTCTEEQVSICAKDSSGPFDYEMTTRLVNLAKKHNLDAVTDIYPRYSSDALAVWRAGYDTRAALIGPGVQASHGMERTHIKGLMNTLELCAAYLELI